MDKIESNKSICGFMGSHQIKDTYFINGMYMNLKESDLKYHSDWNWLMEVVGKIENLGFEFFIVESRCKIAHNTDNSIETIIDFEIVGSKIEAVYMAVIEFIKLYNQQKV